MPKKRLAKITEKQMDFIGDFDKTIYDVLCRASNEELSRILHGGGYAIEKTWGHVFQVMLERVCKERQYDPWTRKQLADMVHSEID